MATTKPKDPFAFFLKFWNTIDDFKGKVGVIVAGLVSLTVLVCLFIFPIFGLVILFMASAVLIILSLIWAYEAIDNYWYYHRNRR